jgi:hypothetical protein
MTRRWTGDGPLYEIAWGEETWTLRVDADNPGLYSARSGPLLGLEGLAEAGRRDVGALSAMSLVSHECRFDRVEATYRPEGWGEMTIQASWFPVEDDGIGLEIEMSARSVEELHRVEVMILSALEPPPPIGSHRSAEPRDRDSAALSYDGRESDLSALVTGPPGEPIGPWLASKTGRDGWAYVEMVRPEDASRRISEGKLPFRATRYGLFGYDLERGVVLRGRIRGFWLPSSGAFDRAEPLFREFLDEPPPLRT